MAAADEISRKFVLIAKKKGISITKSKKSLRNGSKIWSRRNSYQCDQQHDPVIAASSVENTPSGAPQKKNPQQQGRSNKGLSLLGIDATDFPPPLMQQSKTPNNIKSVIRQVNFVRAPRDLMKAGGGKTV